MSQKQQIKNHLQQYGTITPLDALRKFGCFRLAARISELRDEGLEIETDKTNKYAVYRLKQLELF